MSASAFPESPLVAALVTDLASPPRLLYFEGYLGLSSRRDYTRLYIDRFLNEFLDFPKASVGYVLALPTGRCWPSGGSAIWVDLGTLEGSSERPVYYRIDETQTPLSIKDLTDLGRPSGQGRDDPHSGTASNKASNKASDNTSPRNDVRGRDQESVRGSDTGGGPVPKAGSGQM